jgi:putative membrane protein
MKPLIRKYFTNLFSMWLISNLNFLITFDSYFPVIFLASLVFTIFDLIVKPALKLIFLPINFLTLGLLRFIPFTVTFYLVITFFPDIHLKTFTSPGFSLGSLMFPLFRFGFVSSLVLTSFCYFVTKKLLIFLYQKDST